jgi:hypothetical protein
MRRSTAGQSASSRLKGALQAVWSGTPEDPMKTGAAATELQGKNIVFHVHRHQREQQRRCEGRPVTPPLLIRKAALPLLQRPLHDSAISATVLVPWVPTAPLHESKIYSLLDPGLKSKLTIKAFRNLLLRNFVYFSFFGDGLFCLNPLIAKADGFGAADSRFEAEALEDWARIAKAVQILPLDYTPIATVVATYEEVHRELLPKIFLMSLTDICDFRGKEVRMKVDVFLPGKGSRRPELTGVHQNMLLAMICDVVPTKFVKLPIVCGMVSREQLKVRGLDNWSVKRLILSRECAHAVELEGEFVRLASSFSHGQAGRADAKYNDSHFSQYEEFKTASAANGFDKPKQPTQSLTQKIRNLLPTDMLKESLPTVSRRVCTTTDEGLDAAKQIQTWLRTQVGKPKELRALGLDLEWSNEKRVALLQLATPAHAFLFRLHISGSPTSLMANFPTELLEILNDASVLKLGVGIHCDAQRLKIQHDVNARGCLDVREMMLFSGYPSAACSLQELVHSICKIPLPKVKEVSQSNWEDHTLSPEQETYAGNDALSSLVAGLALAKLVPPGTFDALVDHRDGLSIKLLVRMNTIRRIRRMIERLVDGSLRSKAEARLAEARTFGDLQKLHYVLASRYGPESAPSANDEQPSLDEIISNAVNNQLAKDAQIITSATESKTQPAKPSAPSSAPPPPAPKSIVFPQPAPETRPPAAPGQPLAPGLAHPPGERNKLVEQYMMLQQQRTSTFSGIPRSTPPPPAPQPPPAAAAAAEITAGAQTNDADDLEALQREFESQYSDVLASAASGQPAAASPGAHFLSAPPSQQHRSPPTAVVAPAPASGPPPAFNAAGGFLQPEITQIPTPPAPLPSKKPIDALPPSTKKYNGGGGRADSKSEQSELIQRLTSELLSAAVPVPAVTRKMPPHPNTLLESDATLSINVDQLRMMLEALKR